MKNQQDSILGSLLILFMLKIYFYLHLKFALLYELFKIFHTELSNIYIYKWFSANNQLIYFSKIKCIPFSILNETSKEFQLKLGNNKLERVTNFKQEFSKG